MGAAAGRERGGTGDDDDYGSTGTGAAAFEQSLEVMLAAVARSVAESAKAGIEGRFERYRQARRRPPPLAETSTARETVPAVLAVNQWSAGEPAPVRAGAAAGAPGDVGPAGSSGGGPRWVGRGPSGAGLADRVR